MFGPDDAFLTMLVKLVRTLPVYPMFGRGNTKLQPVYVEDVAKAITKLMIASDEAVAPCYELGGPRVYAYKELLRTIATQIGVRTKFLSIPISIWRPLAWFAEHLPGSPLTRNQVALMRRESVASGDFPGLVDLAIEPTPMEAILPAVDPSSAIVQR
jgi:NADH dehydrogenase